MANLLMNHNKTAKLIFKADFESLLNGEKEIVSSVIKAAHEQRDRVAKIYMKDIDGKDAIIADKEREIEELKNCIKELCSYIAKGE